MQTFSPKNIQNCFPEVGRTTIKHWDDAGVLPVDRDSRGYMIFPEPKAILTGIVVQASHYGVYRADHIQMLIGHATDRQQPQLSLAWEPILVMEYCRAWGYDVSIALSISSEKRENPKEHHTTAKNVRTCMMVVEPLDVARETFKAWLGMNPWQGMVMMSATFISVKAIARHIEKTLGVTLDRTVSKSLRRTDGYRGDVLINR